MSQATSRARHAPPPAPRRYFGTDGMRGAANTPPITPDVVMRLAVSAGRRFRRGDHRHKVVIGKDTRLSGYMLESALMSGFTAAGMDVYLVGPMPTPAVGMLTRSMRCDLGVMISASHNPYQDNGIKLFGPDGFKLSDADEVAIARGMEPDAEGLPGLAPPAAMGRASRIADAAGRYVEFVKATFPAGLRLDGLTVAVDCAHGAAHRIAPKVFHELGARVLPLSVAPDGTNINRDCGAVAPEAMCAAVRDGGADIGLALDGDADRLVVCDERGDLIHGDQLMAVIAGAMAARGALRGPVVGTVMANSGLERWLAGRGLSMIRTPVGDRSVVEAMRAKGSSLGGEPSGHIILGDHTPSGDALIAALQVLAVRVARGEPMSRIGHVFELLPQMLVNVRAPARRREILRHPDARAAIADAERRLGPDGRLLIRPSGTEPLIRIMAEGPDRDTLSAVVNDLRAAIQARVS